VAAGLSAHLRRLLRPPRRLRFTREGRWFCGITIGIGVAAINTGNNLLYLVLGMMLSLIVASGILSELALRQLRLSRLPPARLHAGRPFLMGITLRNDKQRLPSFSIEIEDLLGGRPLDKKCYFLKVPAGRQQSTSYRHTFPRRGRYPFSGFRVSTKFPFALFRKSRDIEAAGEIIVFPQVFEIAPPQSGGASQRGDDPRARMGRSGEFFGLRDWRPGDDRRDVNWRKSAQRGRPVVREHQDEQARRVTLQLDNALPSGAQLEDHEALERAISVCASLATHFVARGYTVRLSARGTSVGPGSGAGHLARILRCLALLETAALDAPWTVPPPAPGDPSGQGGELVLIDRCGVARPANVAAGAA
jgi:uncharacterized protein (DUF58 family)